MTPRRKRGTNARSPLDALTPAVARELERRCESITSYRDTCQWLLKQHGIKTSEQGLSSWRQRRLAQRESARLTRSAAGVAFEITITAPGARRLSVRVQPARESFTDNGNARKNA